MKNDTPETPPTVTLPMDGSEPSADFLSEADRLHVLDSYGIPNDELQPILDLLCEHAAISCGVPIAAITLDVTGKCYFSIVHYADRS